MQDASTGDAGIQDAQADAMEVKCKVTAPTVCPDPPPTFAADIRPIVAEHCLSCHDGHIGGPWPLTSYDHVASWADNLRTQMLTCGMPPADAGDVLDTSDSERILTWLKCGYPP